MSVSIVSIFSGILFFSFFAYVFGGIPALLTGALFSFCLVKQVKPQKTIWVTTIFGILICFIPLLIVAGNEVQDKFFVQLLGSLATGGLSAFVVSSIAVSMREKRQRRRDNGEILSSRPILFSLLLFTVLGPLVGLVGIAVSGSIVKIWV